jgi:hypothetical protein
MAKRRAAPSTLCNTKNDDMTPDNPWHGACFVDRRNRENPDPANKNKMNHSNTDSDAALEIAMHRPWRAGAIISNT